MKKFLVVMAIFVHSFCNGSRDMNDWNQVWKRGFAWQVGACLTPQEADNLFATSTAYKQHIATVKQQLIPWVRFVGYRNKLVHDLIQVVEQTLKPSTEIPMPSEDRVELQKNIQVLIDNYAQFLPKPSFHAFNMVFDSSCYTCPGTIALEEQYMDQEVVWNLLDLGHHRFRWILSQDQGSICGVYDLRTKRSTPIQLYGVDGGREYTAPITTFNLAVCYLMDLEIDTSYHLNIIRNTKGERKILGWLFDVVERIDRGSKESVAFMVNEHTAVQALANTGWKNP